MPEPLCPPPAHITEVLALSSQGITCAGMKMPKSSLKNPAIPAKMGQSPIP